MRDVEDGELGDALRMQQSSAPGDGGAPIMSREKDFCLAELIGDGDDVGDEFGERVISNAEWFAAEIVAALVGDDGAKGHSTHSKRECVYRSSRSRLGDIIVSGCSEFLFEVIPLFRNVFPFADEF